MVVPKMTRSREMSEAEITTQRKWTRNENDGSLVEVGR